MSDKELTLEELDNIIAGTTYEIGTEKALENKENFRDKQLEELKQQKEVLEKLKETKPAKKM